MCGVLKDISIKTEELCRLCNSVRCDGCEIHLKVPKGSVIISGRTKKITSMSWRPKKK